MDLCVNGCNDVWNSRELLEVLDDLVGVNNQRAKYSTDLEKEDITLFLRIERKAKAKLVKKGHSNATQSNTNQR